MREKYTSIKLKLLRIILATSGVVLFLTSSAFFAYEFFTFTEHTKDQLSTTGKIIASASIAALALESHNDASEILQAVKADPHVVAACIYDTAGKIFARYPLTLSESSLPLHPSADGYEYVNARLEGFEPIIRRKKRFAASGFCFLNRTASSK